MKANLLWLTWTRAQSQDHPAPLSPPPAQLAPQSHSSAALRALLPVLRPQLYNRSGEAPVPASTEALFATVNTGDSLRVHRQERGHTDSDLRVGRDELRSVKGSGRRLHTSTELTLLNILLSTKSKLQSMLLIYVIHIKSKDIQNNTVYAY